MNLPMKPNALEKWPQIARQVRTARHIILFLDFDGSLVPLRELPEQARLGPDGRRILTRLARHPRITAVIISGRQRDDLRRRVNVSGALYLGLHGWEGSNSAVRKKSMQRRLRPVARMLARQLGQEPGIRIEDKEAAIAVHYRGAHRNAIRRAQRTLRAVLKAFPADLHCVRGKSVWEIMPRAIQGKNTAVQKVLDACPFAPVCIYIGDDHSDEKAFAVLPQGLTVRVGPTQQTRARFRLRNPGEVMRFLNALEGTVSQSSDTNV
jgi:trehalose-phosphatase